MPRKINSIGVKLGVFQVWYTKFYKYGKTFKSYSRFLHQQLKLLVYLNHFLFTNNLLVDNIHIYFTHCSIFINIFIFNTKNSYSIFSIKNTIPKTLGYWVKIPVVLNFYKKLNLTNSSFLLSNYLTSLALQGGSPKKLLQSCYKLIKTNSKKIKLVQTPKGTKKVILTGFKLKFSGCFEMSRSQIAKTLKYSFGSSSSTQLKTYVEYSNNIIYTKSGSCGLKIWLFYDFITL